MIEKIISWRVWFADSKESMELEFKITFHGMFGYQMDGIVFCHYPLKLITLVIYIEINRNKHLNVHIYNKQKYLTIPKSQG